MDEAVRLGGGNRAPAGGELVDDNLASNKHTYEPKPPDVLGDGPGPYEVIVFKVKYYGGPTRVFECKPSQRQAPVAALTGDMECFNAIKIEGKVNVQWFRQPQSVNAMHYSPGSKWLSNLSGPFELPFLKDVFDYASYRSLIVCPKEAKSGIMGVLLAHGSVFGDTTRVFPMREEWSDTHVKVDSVEPINNNADWALLFKPTLYDNGDKNLPTYFLDVTLFDGLGGAGDKRSVAGTQTTLGDIGFQDRVSSLEFNWPGRPAKP